MRTTLHKHTAQNKWRRLLLHLKKHFRDKQAQIAFENYGKCK